MNTLIICLFIAILLPYLLKLIVAHYMAKEGTYDNHYPREQQARLQGIGARAVAAHQNGFESLLVFSTASLTALATGHVGTNIQLLAVIYIISRVVYNILYLKKFSIVAFFNLACGCCLLSCYFIVLHDVRFMLHRSLEPFDYAIAVSRLLLDPMPF